MDLDMVAPTLAEDDMEKMHSEVNNRLNTLLDVMAKLSLLLFGGNISGMLTWLGTVHSSFTFLWNSYIFLILILLIVNMSKKIQFLIII